MTDFARIRREFRAGLVELGLSPEDVDAAMATLHAEVRDGKLHLVCDVPGLEERLP